MSESLSFSLSFPSDFSVSLLSDDLCRAAADVEVGASDGRGVVVSWGFAGVEEESGGAAFGVDDMAAPSGSSSVRTNLAFETSLRRASLFRGDILCKVATGGLCGE